MKRKNVSYLWIGIGICLFLILLSGLLARRFTWARNLVHTVLSPVTGIFSSASSWADERMLAGTLSREELLSRVEELETENAQLREENRYLKSQARKTGELEALLGISDNLPDYEKTGANVIGLSPSNYYDLYLVDKGLSDGIREYMPVITDEGLVGRISRVYEDYAEVTTLIGEGSAVYGQVNRPQGDLVVLKGLGTSSLPKGITLADTGLMEIRFAPSEHTLSAGDEIVTSSLSQIYPPGLLIGHVVRIDYLSEEETYVAYVKPSADLSQVDMVLIITEGEPSP